MALASVLQRPLPVNQHGFFGLGGRADLLDLGPGSPGDGLSLAAPGWGVPEEPRIEMLHGTTTLAFKVLSQPPCGSRLSGIPAGTEAGGGSVLSPRPLAVSPSDNFEKGDVGAGAGEGRRPRQSGLAPRRPRLSLFKKGSRGNSEPWRRRENCCSGSLKVLQTGGPLPGAW